MLKSLQSDILHEAESKDLKVIIISGIYLIPILRVLAGPGSGFSKFFGQLGHSFAYGRIVFEAPLQEYYEKTPV